MANIKSQKKRILTNERRRLRNKSVKSSLHTAIRAFRTAADRNAALLEQVVAPSLRAKNPERRREGLEDLQALADIAQELSTLLLGRDLRRLSAR